MEFCVGQPILGQSLPHSSAQKASELLFPAEPYSRRLSAANVFKSMTPELQRLFAGYHCVFVGDPKECTPYACFATEKQAENLNKLIFGKYPLMTVEEWAKQFELPEV